MSLGPFIRGMFGPQHYRHSDAAMQPHPLVGQTARYTFVGAICAATNNAVMILGDLAGEHYVPMMVLSFALVTPLGYLLHSGFTFNERLSLDGLLRFACGIAVGFPLSLLTMAILCTELGLRVVIAAPVATLVLFLWNYASAHWAIIGRSRFR
ncbi:MAG: GtrA family protein [Beijerinckiaceae bacterium]